MTQTLDDIIAKTIEKTFQKLLEEKRALKGKRAGNAYDRTRV